MGVGEEEGTEKSQKPMFIHTHMNTSEGVEEPRVHHLSDASSFGRESPPDENRPSVLGDIQKEEGAPACPHLPPILGSRI